MSKTPKRLTEEQRARVEQWVPLAKWAMKRFRPLTEGLTGLGLTWDEVEQTAMLGIMRAAQRYDPARGASFKTYAVAAIRGSLRQEYRNITQRRRKHPTIGGVEVFDRVGPSVADPNDSGGEDRVPKRAGLAHLNLTRYYRREAKRVGCDTRHPGVPGALPEPSEKVLELLAQLDKREREIVVARFGLYQDGETLAEVAARYGITKERVRQIQSRAMKRLRGMYEAEFSD